MDFEAESKTSDKSGQSSALSLDRDDREKEGSQSQKEDQNDGLGQTMNKKTSTEDSIKDEYGKINILDSISNLTADSDFDPMTLWALKELRQKAQNQNKNVTLQ